MAGKRPRKLELKRRRRRELPPRSKIKKRQHEAYDGRSGGERKEVPQSGDDESTDDSSRKPPLSYVIPYDWPSDDESSGQESDDPSEDSGDSGRFLATYRLYGKNLFDLMQSLIDMMNASLNSESRVVNSGRSVYTALGFNNKNFLKEMNKEDSIIWDYLDDLLKENIDSDLEREYIKQQLETDINQIITDIEDKNVKDEDAFSELKTSIEENYGEKIGEYKDEIFAVIDQIESFLKSINSIEFPTLKDLVTDEKRGDFTFSLMGNYTIEVPEDALSLTYSNSLVGMTIKVNNFNLKDEAEFKIEYKDIFGTGWIKISSVGEIVFNSLKIQYTLNDRIRRGSYTTEYGGSNTNYEKFFMTKYDSNTAATLNVSLSGWDVDLNGARSYWAFILFCLFVPLTCNQLMDKLEEWVSSSLGQKLRGKFEDLEGEFHELFKGIFKNLDLPYKVYYEEPFKEDGEQHTVKYSLYSEQERYATKIYSQKSEDSDLPEDTLDDDEVEKPESDPEPEDFGGIIDKQVKEFVQDWESPLSYDEGYNGENSIGRILYSLNKDYHITCPKYLAGKSGLTALKYVLDNQPLVETMRDTLIMSLILDGYTSKQISEMTWERAFLLVEEGNFSKRTIEDLKNFAVDNKQKGLLFSEPGTEFKMEMSSVIVTGIYYLSNAKRFRRYFEEMQPRKSADDLTHRSSRPNPGDPSDETFEPPSCTYSDESTLNRDYGSMFDPLWLGLSLNCILPNRLYSFLVDRGYFDFETSANNPLDTSQLLNCTIHAPSTSPKVDFSGSDGNTPQLKITGVTVTVEWGGEQFIRPIIYGCAVKIPLKPVFLSNDCLKKLSDEALSELAEIIPCLRELGWDISDDDYLSALFQHFIFLEPQASDIEVLITDIEDLASPFEEDNLTESQRKELLHSILKAGYEKLIPIPVLFDIFHPYSRRVIEEYNVEDGWLNIYETYDTPNLDFDIL